MPVSVHLVCRRCKPLIEALRRCPSLATAIQEAADSDEMIHIDVRRILVAEDLFGDKYIATTEDEDCWRTSMSIDVMYETDLGADDFIGYVGKWNLRFLGWLKSVSINTCERMEIEYEHERGDYLYEIAWWSSDPSSSTGEVEVFGIQNHEGMIEPEWRREAIRFADGRIMVRANERTEPAP